MRCSRECPSRRPSVPWEESIHDTGPRNRAGALAPGLAERSRERGGLEATDGCAERLWCRVGDEACRAVFDEFERSTRVGRRDDGLAREKGLERDVAIVLIERRKHDGARACVQLDQRLFVDAAGEDDAIRNAGVG